MIKVYITIDNSNSKLTRGQWCNLYVDINNAIHKYAVLVLGEWLSEATSSYQDACWCVHVDTSNVGELKRVLKDIASRYQHSSVAWGEVLITESLKA